MEFSLSCKLLLIEQFVTTNLIILYGILDYACFISLDLRFVLYHSQIKFKESLKYENKRIYAQQINETNEHKIYLDK